MKFVEQHGDRGALHLMLVERLDGGEARGGAGPRAGGGTAHSFNSGWSPERRIDTERACAGSPSAVARAIAAGPIRASEVGRSEEHTSELQSLMRNSYAVFCLKKK